MQKHGRESDCARPALDEANGRDDQNPQRHRHDRDSQQPTLTVRRWTHGPVPGPNVRRIVMQPHFRIDRGQRHERHGEPPAQGQAPQHRVSEQIHWQTPLARVPVRAKASMAARGCRRNRDSIDGLDGSRLAAAPTPREFRVPVSPDCCRKKHSPCVDARGAVRRPIPAGKRSPIRCDRPCPVW